MTSLTTNTKVVTLDELFSYQDERFVHYAYLTILGRSPDSEGMLYYLKRVRSGTQKLEVLAQLRLSKEGAIRPSSIVGLDKKIRKYYWLNLPVIGSVLKMVTLGPKPRQKLNNAANEAKTSVEAAHQVFDSGRGVIAFNLKPMHQLEPDNSNKNNWISLGEDPYFNLAFDLDNSPSSGWYSVDLRISFEGKKSISKLYLDTGHGFNEMETVVLPHSSGESVQRIFLTQKPILAIRFDPNEKKGAFSVDALRLTSISESDSLIFMFSRLSSSHPAYEGMCQEDVETVTKAVALLEKKPFAAFVHSAYATTFQNQQSGIDYEDWIEQVEAPTLPTPREVANVLEAMIKTPLISIIMPTYNTPEVYLRACIESVRSQSYPHWELCIADDASTKPYVQSVLKEYQQADARIRVVFRKENGHISRCSNSALEITRGKFVALLDHDDELPQHALYFVALAINEKPEVQVLYSDEDKIDGHGIRFEPHFKSGWNPDLFFSQNYVSHLGVYKRDLLTRIGGFRNGVEGSQDQDLLLRCLPYLDRAHIGHIPKVLYHWRAAEGSTALGSSEKNYTTQAGIKALQDYFLNEGPKGVQVSAGVVPNTYRVRYPIPTSSPLVSLLIPTRDRLHLIEPCVHSILNKSTYKNFEILILDNGSQEPDTLRFLKNIAKDSRVRVLRYDYPFNYSAINNYGAQQAMGSIIGLVNNDIEVIKPDWLTEMVSHACRAEIGCVGAKLYYENGTIQHAGVICGLGGVAGHGHREFPNSHPGYFAKLVTTQTVSAVTGACLLVRREVYEEVGGLDALNLTIAFNDVDFCLKVRQAGYRNLWTPYAELYHYESISRGAEDTTEKQTRFLSEISFMHKKWGKELQRDPFYSPNLTKENTNFSIRAPSCGNDVKN
jgi:O-antigen biosynthesis protein